MSVFDSVRTILAIRDYSDRPLPAEAIARIVEAGRLSGSTRNGQPWHFIVIDDPENLRQVAELSKSGPYIAGAPLAIAVAILKESRWGVGDASRAIQNMVLTAWDEGIGSNWVGYGGMTAVAELLGLPAEYDLFAVLPFGYPANDVGKGVKKRKPLTEVASHGRFGSPYTG